ncbi:MAG: hypothetical protein D3909_16900 [Candidatus Electrothrix sp. ATG1]|nr:hypothetical protein [Candidatus Electrothrix sp. ATG1]MCI5211428.1 hypothetical protein [Candidatus Electrothrix sp. ATG2]
MDYCEWNPKTDSFAACDEEFHGFATVSAGTGRRNIHLCRDCASLPRFKRFKKVDINKHEWGTE